MEGIAKAKAAGVYKGRPPSVDSVKVQQFKAEGWGLLRSPASSALPAHPFIGI